MNIKWKKFSQWVRWDEWKEMWGRCLIKRIIEWIIDFLKNFSKLILCILKKIIEGVRWIIIPTSLIIIVATLIIAFIKLYDTNAQVQEIINNLKETVHLQTSSDSKYDMMKFLTDMDALKKSVFDSNILTFMVTLIIVFLGSILLDIEARTKKSIKEIEARANKSVKETEKIIIQFTSERKAMSIFIRLQILLVHYSNDQYYRLAKETNEILCEFNEGRYKDITEELRLDFNKIIQYKMLRRLVIDSKTIKKNDQNVKASIEALTKLKIEISRLREV